MRKMRFLTAFAMPALLCGCFGGSSDRPGTIPVSGTVIYKDQPVEGATVSFQAEGAPRAATGVTDAEGRFHLSMFEFRDGAVVGEHTVTISKFEQAAAPPPTTSDQQDPTDLASAMQSYQSGANKNSGPKSLIPEKYSNPATTPLKEKVTEQGPNTFVFTLTD